MSTMPTAANPSGARSRMLAGAAELFRERGVAGTALADIVEHSHAPRGSLYHYFPGGKAQLAEEATATAGRTMGALLSQLLTEQGPEGTIRALVAYFRQTLVDTDFAGGCPVVAGALEGGESPGAREVAGEAFTAWESTIAGVLWQRGVSAQRAERMATLAISAIEGALVLARAQRSTRALDRTETELVALLHDLVPDSV